MRNHQENGNRYQFRLHPAAAPMSAATTATTTPAAAAAASVEVTAATATLPTTTTTAAINTPTALQQETDTTIAATIAVDENPQIPQKQKLNQQQQQQKQNMSNSNNTNNNNNNNNNIANIDKTKKSSVNAALLKCSLTTLPTVGGHGMLKDLHRKQFTPTLDGSNASFSSTSVAGSIQDDMSDQCSLTQAGLEEYNIRASSYYDQPVLFHHQKQSSYAQSEGYHSYVSSSDSSSATPFLDRLRQESEMLSRQSHHWSQNDLSSVASCNSVAPSPTPLLLPMTAVSSNGQDILGSSGSNASQQQQQQHQQHQQQHNNSSESTSSTETLKWLGSMSDVSEASHATGYSAISESVSSSQLIVHSSRVLTPKRHHSESVLYLNDEQQHSPNSLPPQPAAAHQQQTCALQYAHAQISPTLSARDHHSPTRLTANHRHSPSYPPVHNSLTLHHVYQHQHATTTAAVAAASAISTKRDITRGISTSAADLPKSSSFLVSNNTDCSSATSATAATTTPPQPETLATAESSIADESQQQPQNHKSSISVTISSSEAVVTISPQPLPVAVASNSEAIALSPHDGASVAVIGESAQTTIAPLSVVTTTTASNIAAECGNSNSSSGGSGGSSNNSTASISPATSAAYRSNHRLFPVSTYTEPVHSNTSQYVHHPKPQYTAGLQKSVAAVAVQQAQQPQPQQQQQQQPQLTPTAVVASATQQRPATQTPPQPSWQSVAELINDFERSTDPQPQQKFAYIEPSKTHRVSNPALKAFQKNAVQSYFERQQHQQHQQQQQQQQHHQQQQQQQQPPQHSKDNNNPQKIYQPHPSHHHLQQMQQQQMLRPHSFQAAASAKEVSGHQLLRSSLPNTYGSSGGSGSSSSSQTSPHQQLNAMRAGIPSPQKTLVADDAFAAAHCAFTPSKPPSPAPPPPPPRSRSLMPSCTLLRRSSSASDYGEFRDQFMSASQEKLQSQSIKNISSAEKMSFNDCGMPPPPPPPRARITLPPRRTSSASEYAAMRDKMLLQQAAALAHQQHHPQQHQQAAAAAGSRAPHHYYAPTAAVAVLIAAKAPTEPGWVPERPPKNPNLRVPSPDLPPPPTADIDTSLSDEPLPPPPPEILHRQASYYDAAPPEGGGGELLPPKAPSPNRRNSFAGSSTRRSFFSRTASTTSEATTPPMITAKAQPPQIPKKPLGIELLQVSRPASSLAQQSNKAHKVLLNGAGIGGGLHQHHPQQNQYLQQQPQPSPPPQLATKINANRKRPHNPVAINIPPIMENATIGGGSSSSNTTHLKSPTSAATAASAKSPLILSAQKSSPPPPLMPRMPHAAGREVPSVVVASSKLRCNSKASYLPRQSLEKLNTDPDHGSYKLTLTSNEDLVANTKPAAYDILSATTHQNGKLPTSNNLPDVLPLGAKLQPQPASPTSANGSPLRYSSNSNLNGAQTQHQHQPHTASAQSSACYPMYPPTQHRYSSPTMHNYGQNNNNSSSNNHYNMHHNVPSYTRSQSFDVNNSSSSSANGGSPTKFMSQSSIDLKRTLNSSLETTLEEPLAETTHLLSPAQSENNLSSACRNYATSTQPASPSRREFQRAAADLGTQDRGSVTEDSRIFRAELVNTTLSISPGAGGAGGTLGQKSVTRKDSLRENIEKITQLQSKLMSAHLSDTGVGVLSGYGAKPLLSPTARAAATEAEDCNLAALASDKSDAAAAAQLNSSSCSCPEDNISSNISETSNQAPAATAAASAVADVIDNSTDETSLEPPSLPKTPPPLSPTPDEFSALESAERSIVAQISQMDASTDGLKLMQRSEIVLRVNPATAEVASQTDEQLDMADMGQSAVLTAQQHQQHAKEEAAAQTSRTTLQPRERHPIELDCEHTAKELAELLPPNDKLIKILTPMSPKSPTDYVGKLYNPNVPLRATSKRDVGTSTLMRMKQQDSSASSLSLAEERSGVTVELQYAEMEMLLTNGDGETDSCDLTLKKKVDDLIRLLNRKIRILSREQTTIGEESSLNDELGCSLIDKLADKVRPIEATKFRTYIDDVGHITSLLLSLSERLARAENLLSANGGADNNADKKLLESKRDRLLEQLEEAKRLKEDIERRGSSVTLVLEKHLSADEFADFDFFINMKAKLIADARDLTDKIKCGEEQLSALTEMLIQSDC